MRHLTRSTIGLLTGLLLLSGCSSIGSLLPGGGGSTAPAASPSATGATTSAPAGGSSGQSAAEACAAISSAMSAASATLNTAIQDAGSDPAKSMQALTEFKNSFTAAIATVNNAELKAQAQRALDALNKLITLFQDGLNDPTKMTEVVTAVSALQKEFTAIGTLCGG